MWSVLKFKKMQIIFTYLVDVSFTDSVDFSTVQQSAMYLVWHNICLSVRSKNYDQSFFLISSFSFIKIWRQRKKMVIHFDCCHTLYKVENTGGTYLSSMHVCM
jgi:hypothetical protein